MFGVHSINEHLRTLLSLQLEVILFNLSIKQSAFQIVKEHVCCLSTSTFLTVLDKNAEESGHFLYGLTEAICVDTGEDSIVKEVIQPQVPLGLPCYDFTPVMNHTVVNALPKVKLSTSGAAHSHGVTGGVYKARERIHRGILIHDY